MRSLGVQELEVLRFVSDNEPISVADVAQRFELTNGLAKTTILTVMERLRKKGFLNRSKSSGVFVYRSVDSSGQVMREVIANFVCHNLGGTVSPFIAFLTEAENLAPEEVDALRNLLDRLEDKDAR